MPYACHPHPRAPIAALAAAALLTALLPDGRWGDALALFALVAALAAAQDGRTRDMILAAGIAAGLGPTGWLLAPLFVGLAIGDRAAHRLPAGLLAGALVACALPWPSPHAALPNLAALAGWWPDGAVPIGALGAGTAAWLGARATVLPRGALLAEARMATLLLALVLPLPLATLGFLVAIAAWPTPDIARLRAANDNHVDRRTIRLAA